MEQEPEGKEGDGMKKGFNNKSFNNKGFTLAELLIVVAIIAVLVAISIPIFTSQLEKSREAADLANVREAYAEVMNAVMTEDSSAVYGGSAIKQADGSYQAVVGLKQKQTGWQSKLPITIAGVTSESTAGGSAPDPSHWVGQPGTTCTVSYSQSGGVVFTWNGESSGSSEGSTAANTSYSIDDFEGIAIGAWNGNGNVRTNYVRRRSTNSLIEFEPNSAYTLTYTVPAEYTSQGVEIGTLLFTESTGTTSVSGQTINGTEQRANSGWVSSTTVNNGAAAQNYQSVTTNSDSSITITQTINTDADNVWFGANFRVASDVSLSASENATELAAVTAALNSLQITKN